jgi:DoxX-like family
MEARAGWVVWVGRVISALVTLLFLASAVMKLKWGPGMSEGFAHLQLPESIARPLGILEMIVALVYAIPPLAVLGAVLLTGYVGGTIVTAWRIGDPVYVQIVLGLLVWLGLYLREPRLKALLPLRTKDGV